MELKSLKLYYQSFRNEGIYYEAVTNRIRDDLAQPDERPAGCRIITNWKRPGRHPQPNHRRDGRYPRRLGEAVTMDRILFATSNRP